jgi:hypothetical protein
LALDDDTSKGLPMIHHANAYVPFASCIILALAAGGCSRASTCLTKGAAVTITGQHDHQATITAEHVKRGVGGTYVAKGQDHDHLFMLKDADMASLQKGQPVKTVTSSVNAHGHEVVVACRD